MISAFQSTFHTYSERGQHQGSSRDDKYNDKYNNKDIIIIIIKTEYRKDINYVLYL